MTYAHVAARIAGAVLDKSESVATTAGLPSGFQMIAYTCHVTLGSLSDGLHSISSTSGTAAIDHEVHDFPRGVATCHTDHTLR